MQKTLVSDSFESITYHKRRRELLYLYQQIHRMCGEYVTINILWSRLGQSPTEEELKAGDK